MNNTYKRNQLLSLIIFIISIISSLVLTLVVLFNTPLTSFKLEGETYEHGLESCRSCPKMYEHSPYSCLESVECDEGVDLLCEKGEKLSDAYWILYISDLTHVLLLVMILEKVFYNAFQQEVSVVDYYVYIVSQFLIKVLGVVFFILIGDVTVFGECESEDTCSKVGILLEEINLVICLVILISGPHFYSKRTTPQIKNHESTRGNLAKVLVSLLISAVFLFLSLSLNWARFKAGDEFKANLLLFNSYDHHEDIHLSCLSAIKCEENTENIECKALKSLDDASFYYRTLGTVAAFFTVIWIENLILMLLDKRQVSQPISYTLGWIPVLLVLPAVIIWIVVSEGSFGNNCDLTPASTEMVFCIEVGCTLALITAVSFTISAFFHTAANYYMVQYKIVPTVNSPNSPTQFEGFNSIESVSDAMHDFKDTNVTIAKIAGDIEDIEEEKEELKDKKEELKGKKEDLKGKKEENLDKKIPSEEKVEEKKEETEIETKEDKGNNFNDIISKLKRCRSCNAA